MSARCCDWHNHNCEPPSELCCDECTEWDHPSHRDGSVCTWKHPPQALRIKQEQSVDEEQAALRADLAATYDWWKQALTRAETAESKLAAVKAVLAEHWDWKAGRSLHAAILKALGDQ